MIEPRFIGTLSWAKRFVSLDSGKFDPADWPQLAEIGTTVDRRCGCTFILRFPPQVFKSLFMQLRLLRTIAVAPCRSLWYCKTGKDAENFSDEKLRGLIDSVPPIKLKFPNDIDSRGTKTLFRFVDAPVSLLSADVPAHRNQRSGHDLYLDESWQYEQGAIAEIRARSDSYEATRRIIHGETAPDEGSESEMLWQKSTRKTWFCVCVHCKQRIELEFGDAESQHGFKWDLKKTNDGFWDVAAAAKTVRFVCPSCSQTIPWTAGVQRKLSNPDAGACYLAKNKEPDDKIEGWLATAFVFRDWPGLIAEWLTACNAKRLGDLSLVEEFTKKKLVRAWSPNKYYETKVEYPVGDYLLGEKWDGELKHPIGFRCRFVTVDVQQNEYWALCRLWGKYGRSRLFAFKRCFTQPEVADFAKQCEVDPAFVFVDSAYDPRDPDSRGAMWGRTMRMCSEYGFVATNGTGSVGFMHPDNTTKLYSPTKTIDAWQGTELFGRKRKVVLLNYSSRGSKFMLHNLRTQHDEDGRARWTIAADSNEEYRKQAYAERLRKKRSVNGAAYWEWYQVAENHAFDLECAQVVVAHMFGLLGSEGAETADVPSAASS